MNPASAVAYTGLGRISFINGDFDEAVRQYDNVIRLDPKNSFSYAYRAESLLEQAKYTEAISDIIKSLDIDGNDMAFYFILHLPEDQTELLITKLKGMAARNPQNAEWWYYIGEVYMDKKRYNEAIESLQKAYELDADPIFLQLISDCYKELGDFSKALDYIDQALQMDPDNLWCIGLKADILGDSGDVDSAMSQWSEFIERSPDSFIGYYRRGFFKDISGKTDAALEDYDRAIMLYPDYAYAYLGKGDLLVRIGQMAQAKEAYRKVVELDAVPGNNACAMFALLALGEKEKAIDFMNRVIEKDPTECSNYYDAACLYARIGDLNKSLNYLQKAFEKGFRRFHHVRTDDDL